MKDKRIIAIKNPKLRKIRNEFRKLWFEVESSIWRKLHDELEELSFDEHDNILTVDDMAVLGTLERFRSLQKAQSHFSASFRGSICMCGSCGTMDSDMYYNRHHNAWFCLDCVANIKIGYTIMQAKKDTGNYFCDPDDFGQSFL